MAEFKFGFEEAWFRLIIKNINKYPKMFQASFVEEAQLILRIGKLKVGAARVWAEAAGIIEKIGQEFKLTPLGSLIRRRDPDMDDSGIWWVLHYNLASKNSTAWFYASYFNEFIEDEFDKTKLEKFLRGRWDKNHEKPMTDSTFDKLIFSPLKQVFDGTRFASEFGFFTQNESGIYSRKPKGYIEPPVAIVAFALLDWSKKNDRQSVYIDKLLDPWGLGQIFRLDRQVLDKLMIDIGDRYSKQVSWISHTAGLNSISIMSISPLALVSAYYHELEGKMPIDALMAGIADVDVYEKTSV